MHRSHLLAVSACRNRRSIELVHRGLQPLLKVGPNLPLLCKTEPYKALQRTFHSALSWAGVAFSSKKARCEMPVNFNVGLQNHDWKRNASACVSYGVSAIWISDRCRIRRFSSRFGYWLVGFLLDRCNTRHGYRTPCEMAHFIHSSSISTRGTGRRGSFRLYDLGIQRIHRGWGAC